MKKLGFILCISTIIVFFTSCYENKSTRTDTMTSGIAEIVVDECMAPIIDEQINVFEALYPNATIIPTYTNEYDAYQMLVNDSMRLIIGARELTPGEEAKIKAREQRVLTHKIAVDGVAIIVNPQNKLSYLSTADLKKVFTGQATNWKDIHPGSKLGNISVVFDSPNSSTVRFIQDSICRKDPLGSNVKAISKDTATININEKTPNQRVLDYVSSTPNAMGVIGVNWISNPTDTTSLSFINGIKVLAVSKDEVATPDNSYQPYPYQFALNQYPLQRDIYIIITDPSGGLPSGFVNFVTKEKGQRIILKAGLLPATQLTRLVRITTD
ncbi:PstS family phosphate ABC transporter substrate-binding protein [Dysgonomonas sp. 25]|uniref:PstS family phosphate ABC transporter substrate-binding protein n=1 Tax=Dysgonomonas sp. 25 TaxID=2302933 RepID=UPI0013D2F4A9|nr:substrate-binding domain-containing protein [Dysgonomonas sp. 25]NDV69725.1 phosphate ABC transporter substrate-binding protein [Dysgonomonas sp. 25]